ncbi:hypothetical protein HDU96_007812 [Phlyctochytrium bullatum]|nr:hypothetical protein HDU96_007812 [Phlyctochytrium bullatum]
MHAVSAVLVAALAASVVATSKKTYDPECDDVLPTTKASVVPTTSASTPAVKPTPSTSSVAPAKPYESASPSVSLIPPVASSIVPVYGEGSAATALPKTTSTPAPAKKTSNIVYSGAESLKASAFVAAAAGVAALFL